MVELGGSACLALEALAELGLRGEQGVQNLDGNRPPHAHVLTAPDRSHTTFANGLDDLPLPSDDLTGELRHAPKTMPWRGLDTIVRSYYFLGMLKFHGMGKGEVTRQAILDRAVDMARLSGVAAVSIGRLAEELELSKSGVIAHFGTKESM